MRFFTIGLDLTTAFQGWTFYLQIPRLVNEILFLRSGNISVWKVYFGREHCNLQVSLTSIPRKVMEQLILEAIIKQVEEKKLIRSSQHGFTKGK